MIVVRTGGPALRTRLVRSLPKDRGSGDDRLAFREDGLALALCDGASEGWDGAGWAEALAESLCQREDPEAAVLLAREIRTGRDARSIRRIRSARRKGTDPGSGSSGEESWYAAAARARGSWSTALMVRLEAGGRRIAAAALGDTVLFLLDGCRSLESFPLDDPRAFGSSPDLVAENGTECPAFARAEFSLAGLKKPRIVLLTDALAARVLAEPESGRAALWAFLLGAPETAFRSWVGSETEAGRLRRDDLTLLAAV